MSEKAKRGRPKKGKNLLNEMRYIRLDREIVAGVVRYQKQAKLTSESDAARALLMMALKAEGLL